MGADMQGEQERVLGELESAGLPGAGCIIAAVTIHEVLHTRVVARLTSAVPIRLTVPASSASPQIHPSCVMTSPLTMRSLRP